MPKLAISVPHALGQEEAIRRLEEAFRSATETYRDQIHELDAQWNGNVMRYRFNAMGIAVSGSTTVEPSEVKVDANLPLMAVMFKGAIEKRLREELGKLLGAEKP